MGRGLNPSCVAPEATSSPDAVPPDQGQEGSEAPHVGKGCFSNRYVESPSTRRHGRSSRQDRRAGEGVPTLLELPLEAGHSQKGGRAHFH